MAYLMLAECYQPQGELTLAAENARKAYDLRERTSDHEKLQHRSILRNRRYRQPGGCPPLLRINRANLSAR